HALFWSLVRFVRQLSGRQPRPRVTLPSPTDEVVKKHKRFCHWLLQVIPAPAWAAARGSTVCEIGPGDCVATAALLLGAGAARVELVEKFPMPITEKQLEVLNCLQSA